MRNNERLILEENEFFLCCYQGVYWSVLRPFDI